MSAGPWSLAGLHGAAVWVGEARVGSVGGIYASAGSEHIVGFELVDTQGERWFLPWVTCTLEAGAIRCASPLVFIPADQLEFYARHGVYLLREDVTTLWVDLDGRVASRLDGHPAGVSVVAGEGISDL